MKNIALVLLGILSFIEIEAQVLAEKVVKNNTIDLLRNDTIDYKLFLISNINLQKYGDYFSEVVQTIYEKSDAKTLFIETGKADEWLFLQYKNSKRFRSNVGRTSAKNFKERYKYLLKTDAIDSLDIVSISMEEDMFYSIDVLRDILYKHDFVDDYSRLGHMVDSLAFLYRDTGLLQAQELELIRKKLLNVTFQLKNIDSTDYLYFNEIFDEIISFRTDLYAIPFNSVDFRNRLNYYSLNIINQYLKVNSDTKKYIAIVSYMSIRRGKDIEFLQRKTSNNKQFVTVAENFSNEACTIKAVMDWASNSSNNSTNSDISIMKKYALGKKTLFKSNYDSCLLKGNYDYILYLK